MLLFGDRDGICFSCVRDAVCDVGYVLLFLSEHVGVAKVPAYGYAINGMNICVCEFFFQ